MGKRGRKPKPTQLKLIEGNPGKRPLNTSEPVPKGEPVCPAFLGPRAKEVFQRVVDSMPAGVYTGADEFLISSYAIAVESLEEALRDIYARGQRFVDKNMQERRNPSCMIRDKQIGLINQIGSSLGLSPTSRLAIQIPRKPVEDDSDGLLG
ncbi:MAG: phage terminase small subunit P27 family [Gammaproteobacteria bacterium]|nr:phage terminase small subunit P27 family [Gammaproteobacteria bacterium]MDH5801519.1 phage terminase small subunit P27 family [Gammaproteobacteria bacterium]